MEVVGVVQGINGWIFKGVDGGRRHGGFGRRVNSEGG